MDLDLTAGIHTVAFRGAGRSATTPGGGVDKVSLRPANAAITNSDGGTTGELCANVAAGWMANDSVVIGGNVKLVKEGAGTFASHMVQAYTGGTLVAGGTAQPPDGNGANDTYSPAKGYTAFGSGKIVVGEGAFFDLRGNYDFNGALSIDLTRVHAQLAGAGNDDLIRREEAVQRERFFPIGDIQRTACAKKMCPGNSGQNQVVGRCRIEHPVLQNVNIAVGAFSHAPSRAVENRLLTPGLLCLLGSHDRRNQVQRLDIAVEEPCIFCCDQTDRLLPVLNL